jgi:predicted enzyme related to lactoylglutathione lyase
MNLGHLFEFVLPLRDLEASRRFYRHHGFTRLDRPGDDTVRVTDGQIVLAFEGQVGARTRLRFLATDVDAALGRYEDPNGVQVEVVSLATTHRRPPADTPPSEFGTFGEVSLETAELATSVAFWNSCGFACGPYSPIAQSTWESLTNGALAIGLYLAGTTQHRFRNPVLTYFNEDMTDRLRRLKAAGLTAVQELPDPSGEPGHAVVESPEGQMFYLFGV